MVIYYKLIKEEKNVKKVNIFSIIKSKDSNLLQGYLKEFHHLERFDSFGNTPLIVACRYKWLTGVKLLLKAGADIEGKAKDSSWTALMVCVKDSSLICMRYLIDMYALFNKGRGGC